MERNYESIFPAFEAHLLRDMDTAITECNLWDWLKTFTPDSDRGFMFTRHANIDKITSKSKYDGHSGASFAWTMRHMESVAKEGWDAYRQRMLREGRS